VLFTAIRRVFSACVLRLRVPTFSVLFLALFAQFGQASDALSYSKNYFVTGDYVVGGVGLWEKGVNGFATGTITIKGVPAGADIVAAFLYWETTEGTAAPSATNGFFDTKAIVGDGRGNPLNQACGSGGNFAPAGQSARVYRADVLRYLPVDTTNSVRLANGSHTVKLPDNGNKGLPVTSGASLVIVYRVLSSGTPLRSVVIYDGAFSMTRSSASMSQVVGGFYQAGLFPQAKMTQIVANGQSSFAETLKLNGSVVSTNPFNGAQGTRWDNPTFNIGLNWNASSFETDATTSSNQACVTWSAIVASTNVMDTDGDGLLDVWETQGMHLNPGDATHAATFGTCANNFNDGMPCVNLPAMGANPFFRDIFVEIDWEHGTDGHLHIPKLAALTTMATTFLFHGIVLHFDVGNNYQSPQSPFIVPAKYAQGGQVIEESTLLCPNAQTNVCAFPNLPYAAQGWKVGFKAVKDGFPALNIPAHFARNRKDIFHYVLFAHALATPSATPGIPNSVSGVADRPGGDLMVTLGLWRSDTPSDDQTGSVLVQAGTLMHELGHNLGLSHAGLFRAPNCEPNYPSVMNYLYQTRGLTDNNGGSHIDYSYGLLPSLNEGALSESVFQHAPLIYRVRYYGPPSSVGIGTAKTHCDGTPLTGDFGVRLESPLGATIDWNNTGKIDSGTVLRDIDFNGVIGDPVKDSVDPTLPAGAKGKRWLVDSNDWGNLNLQQVGARLDVGGLSLDVGQTDLGQTDLGQTDLGQTDLGQTDLGQTDLGQTDLGQTDLGQTDLGDVDYATVIATLDPTSPSQPLAATSSLTGVTTTWGAPSLGQIRQYNIWRSDALNPTPAIAGSVSGTPPATTFTNTVNQLLSVGPAPAGSNSGTTFYNTTYTYFVASVDINGTSSGPSNTVTGLVKHLFITANNKTRVYGNANPSFDYATAGQNPGTSGTTTCTTTATQNSNAGTYPITCAGLTPVAGVTYIPGALTITPAPLTIAAVTNTKTYDGTTSATALPTVTGIKLSKDTVTGLAETYDTKNAGTGKTMSVSAYTVNDGNAGGNYTVAKTTVGTGVINKAALTIQAVTNTKTYDANTSAAAVPTTPGLQTGDTVTGLAETYDTPNAGSGKVLTVSPYTVNDGNGGNNYNVVTASVSTGVINQAPASVTANPASKTYGTADPPFTGTLAGFVASDNVTAAYSRTPGETVAGSPYTISATLSPMPVLANYAIAYNTANFTILKANASVTPNANSKTYGTPDPAPITTGTLTGFLAADGVTATYARILGEDVVGSPYTISASLTPAGVLGNYNITSSSAGFTINPAVATVVLNDMTQTYTGSPLTPSVSTIPPGIAVSLAGAPDTNAGSYPVTAMVTNPNYTGASGGAFVVTQAPATVTFSNLTQTFTGSPLSPTVTTNPAGLAYSFTGAPDTAIGSYPFTATVTDPNYTGSASDTFTISPTIDLTTLVLNGAAAPNGAALRLTNDTGETSSAWLAAEHPVDSGFSTSFDFQISPVAGDTQLADGFAFVIQFAPGGTATLGTTGMGGYLGYTGVPNSIAIEFDTFQNSAFGDPVGDHIAILSNGTFANSADHTTLANLAGPTGVVFSDGVTHTATVTYDGATLKVFLGTSTTPVVTAPVILNSLLSLDSGRAFVGFTAATGQSREFTDILGWRWN
jgi:hypothetical protein